MCDQLRRAAISVPSNIAEGTGRISVKETIQFLEIAYGSLMELYCQLQLSVDLEYISYEDFGDIKPLIYSTSKLLSGLRRSKMNQLYCSLLTPLKIFGENFYSRRAAARVKRETLTPGMVLSRDEQTMRVAPVVTTSSTRRMCLPAKLLVSLSRA